MHWYTLKWLFGVTRYVLHYIEKVALIKTTVTIVVIIVDFQHFFRLGKINF